ncbi:MAG: ceramidase domain-containing protein [Pseudomonadota bacterium]
MEWTRTIDGYCERIDPTYWAEPINAVTNGAFLIAALIMYLRVRGQGLPLAMALVMLLTLIGIGSYLFHTNATVWAAIADTTPIALFILTYLFAANLHFWRWPLWKAVLGTAAFIPYVLITVPIFQRLPFFDVSAGYWPVPILIGAYAYLLRSRLPEVSRGLALGAGVLVVSLLFRSVDETLCAAVPFGTHFVWHILNGIMLGWMIEVYRRHMLALRPGGG